MVKLSLIRIFKSQRCVFSDASYDLYKSIQHIIDLSYNYVKRGKTLKAMFQGTFLATIRNANDVFMKCIGSPTTCIVQCQWENA
jgi:hypothetical protein